MSYSLILAIFLADIKQKCIDLNTFYLCTPTSDIDECAAGVSGCEQICSNNAGSFNCDCNDGYALKADRKTCILGEM